MSSEGPQDPSQEHMERIVSLARGPKGETGAQGAPGMTHGARLGFVYLSIVMLLLTAANLLFTSILTGEANHRAQAQCRFDADLGSAPVAANPKTGKPSLLGVSIVSDARVAWHQTDCMGRLAAPDPSFVRWATAFHLPIN